MTEYLVTWSIDIDAVDNERQAAEAALAIMRDPESGALCFEVSRPGKRKVHVDLERDETAVEQLKGAAEK